MGGEALEEHAHSDALPDTPLPSMALFLSFSSASSPPSSVFVGNLKSPSPSDFSCPPLPPNAVAAGFQRALLQQRKLNV